MAKIKYQSSNSPPKKYRDPRLVGRSPDEVQRTQEKYIRETVKASARNSLRQGTMAATWLCIGTEQKKQLFELREKLLIEQNVLLNMALAHAYSEAKQRNLSTDELRSRIKATIVDEESVSFEMNESVLEILFESGIDDAQFIYVNAGLDLLYIRLIGQKTSSMIWN